MNFPVLSQDQLDELQELKMRCGLWCWQGAKGGTSECSGTDAGVHGRRRVHETHCRRRDQGTGDDARCMKL